MEIDGGNAWLLEPAISLDEGIYGVVWQAEAADGHTVRGVIRFGVGDVFLAEPAVEDEGTEATGDLETELAAEELGTGGGGGPVASIASAISNLGVIIGWGGALFAAFVALPRMTWVGHYLLRIMRIAGIVAVVGAVIDLASQLLGGSSWNLIAAALLRLLAGAALAGIPGMVNGSPFVGPQRSGDRLVCPRRPHGDRRTTVADGRHGCGARDVRGHLGGGILALAIALALVLRKRTQEASLVPDGSELAVRFSRLATYSVFGVAVTGVVMAFFILPSPGALVTTAWGWILLIKVALVAALAFFGYRNHFHAIPEIEYAQVQRVSGSDVREEEREHLGQLRKTLGPEMALVVAILIMSGLLVQASPIAG